MFYTKKQYINALMWRFDISKTQAKKEYNLYKADKIDGVKFLDALVITYKRGSSEKLLPIYY